MEIAPSAPLHVFGMPLNMTTLCMSWIVMAVLIFAAWAATRHMREVPSRWQLCMEMFVDFFDTLAQQALGDRGRKYLPFVGSVFLFVWGSNLIGLIPGFEEPTRDLNTPVGLALLAIATAHLSAIVVKGFRTWWWEFFEPSFPASGKIGATVAVLMGVGAAGAYVIVAAQVLTALPAMGQGARAAAIVVLLVVLALMAMTTVFAFQKRRVPNLPMAPLNFVGELGKSVSLPFRLYGNVFGGAVIIIVLSHLLRYAVLPLILMFFFGVFVGTIQAFVFAMLSLTYVAVALAEDEPAPAADGDAAGEPG